MALSYHNIHRCRILLVVLSLGLTHCSYYPVEQNIHMRINTYKTKMKIELFIPKRKFKLSLQEKRQGPQEIMEFRFHFLCKTSDRKLKLLRMHMRIYSKSI